MAYSELIKNFEKIRSYMRDFYVFGFKSRDDYESKKSLRSYDNERRRIESWLGDHMGFTQTQDGKNVFISIDSRRITHNPLYNAFKAKSFTDGDITLHFILFDILFSPDTALSISDIMDIMDEKYLSYFEDPAVFDESTVRKKLKEYVEEGIIVTKKHGKRLLYSRAPDICLPDITDAVDFFSETVPCGAIGSFLLDKADKKDSMFTFKHHYITGAIDSEVVAAVFDAMHKKCSITVKNLSPKQHKVQINKIIPLRILLSVQTGRQYLLAYSGEYNNFLSYRIDYLSEVKIGEVAQRFDELRDMLETKEKNMWGVNFGLKSNRDKKLEHVEFTVRIGDGEEYIVRRLEREKRTGTVERIDKYTCRFSADVYDTTEMIPWIRTFICRLESLNFSNRTVENNFKKDIEEMYALYGLSGGEAQ